MRIRPDALYLCVIIFACDCWGQSGQSSSSPVDLNRKFVSVDIARISWPKVLNVFLARQGIPLIMEFDELVYRSASLTHNKTEDDMIVMSRLHSVHLTNVTTKTVIEYILEKMPNYTYEILDKTVVHIYPVGIKKVANWPLDITIRHFSIDQNDISKRLYQTKFEALLNPMRIDFGNNLDLDYELVQCFSLKEFDDIKLRNLLLELSITCRVTWVFERLPVSEVKLRIEDWSESAYPQGKRILSSGGDWYQLYYFHPTEDAVQGNAIH